MTAEISDIIKQIKSKFIDVNDKLNHELTKNNSLNTEIEEVKRSLEEQQKQNESLKYEIIQLKKEIESLNEQNNKPIVNQDKDLEIDLLVREIDHCIQQLKKN